MWRKICAALGVLILFWNVENLFDPFDDPLKNDDEFTARAERHWTWGRFVRKCDGIAQVVLAAGDITGAVVFLRNEKAVRPFESDIKLAGVAAKFLGNQTE